MHYTKDLCAIMPARIRVWDNDEQSEASTGLAYFISVVTIEESKCFYLDKECMLQNCSVRVRS